jgi:hypothetical protein
MAPHYAGGTPEEACQTESIDISLDNLYIPGNGDNFDIETILDVDSVMHDGELVDGDKVAARNTLTDFLEEYDEGGEELGIFLGYAENGWSSEQMWLNSDYGRSEVYQATEKLEEEHGLVETDFGDVDLTARGQEVYDAFTVLSEDENLLEER